MSALLEQYGHLVDFNKTSLFSTSALHMPAKPLGDNFSLTATKQSRLVLSCSIPPSGSKFWNKSLYHFMSTAC